MFAVACLAALLILTPILITVVIAESGSIVPAVGVWEANVQAVCLTRKLKVEVAERLNWCWSESSKVDLR